jgi:signal transduction histidine kinase
MLQRLYTFFIEPRQKDEDLRNREFVLNVLLAGTLVLLLCGVLLLLVSYFVSRHLYVLPRLAGVSAALVATWWIYFLSRNGYHRLAPWLLVGVYLMLATSVAARWGVALPSSVLLFGFIIILAGVLLGPRYMGYLAVVTVCIVLGINMLQSVGVIHPDLEWMREPYDPGTIIGFCAIYGVFAAISWLFNERTEQSLLRARRAEAGLRRQKLLLESKVEERTRELQGAQLERMQQLYRFAELGQLSTALLHDLANHLTTPTLDIEGLETESRHSAILKRAKRSIKYIDNMVLRVRDQLRGRVHIHPFNVATETEEVLAILTHRAAEAGVKLTYDALSDKKELVCRGESVRFRQLMANMISNGIDAYDGTSGSLREVQVTLEAVGSHIVVTVTDWGKGIEDSEREKLFEPFYSTKATGMGMGLFVARQIVEEQFKGNISLESAVGQTSFSITLAKL